MTMSEGYGTIIVYIAILSVCLSISLSLLFLSNSITILLFIKSSILLHYVSQIDLPLNCEYSHCDLTSGAKQDIYGNVKVRPGHRSIWVKVKRVPHIFVQKMETPPF
jgi:hypothetical protein